MGTVRHVEAMKGWLNHNTPNRTWIRDTACQWQKRYFVLKDHFLYCFEDVTSVDPLARLDMRRMKGFHVDGLQFTIDVDHNTEYDGTHSVTWTLGALTHNERSQWLEALDSARRAVGHALTQQGLSPRGAEEHNDDVNYTAAMAGIMKRA